MQLKEDDQEINNTHSTVRMLADSGLENELNEIRPKKRMSTCTIVLFVIYFTSIVLVTVCAFARFSSLLSRYNFRKNLTTFPDQCSSWSIENGCTRVSFIADQCTRAEKIPTDGLSNIFNVTQAIVVNDKINICVKSEPYARLQYPKTL